MSPCLLLLLGLGSVLSASLETDRRQASNCDVAVPNPCGATVGQLYYPHPTDNTKFLQCADGGRMYIIKCPAGELYNQASLKCSKPQVVTNPGTISINPCTPQNLAAGKIFFQYPGDNTKFIECSPNGTPRVLACPSKLVYSSAQQRCTLQAGTQTGTGTTGTGTGTTGTGTGTPTVVQPGTGSSANPCSANAVATDNLFFPFSADTSKFIHCDLAGNPYIMQCPAGLIWQQSSTSCASAFTVGTVG